MKKSLIAVLFGVLLAAGGASAQIVIGIGPPPVRHEVIPPRPGPNYVWVGGFQRYEGRAYVWVPGHYVVPPHRHARWVLGHWAHRRGGYVWVEGHWRG
jgi:YXWGXW repeat-containing protein